MRSSNRSHRLVTAGVFAALVVGGPLAAHFAVTGQQSAPSSLATCSNGEVEDLYTDTCVPELTPRTGQSSTMSAPVVAGTNDSGAVNESVPGDPNSLPTVDGIPITNPSASIGLEESGMDNDIPVVHPESTLSSSP